MRGGRTSAAPAPVPRCKGGLRTKGAGTWWRRREGAAGRRLPGLRPGTVLLLQGGEAAVSNLTHGFQGVGTERGVRASACQASSPGRCSCCKGDGGKWQRNYLLRVGFREWARCGVSSARVSGSGGYAEGVAGRRLPGDPQGGAPAARGKGDGQQHGSLHVVLTKREKCLSVRQPRSAETAERDSDDVVSPLPR